MKILVTGFDPFGGEDINPAYEAVKRLPDTIAGFEIVKAEIPTEFHNSKDVLRDLLTAGDFNFALAVGLAGGRSEICIERIGINIDDARIPDNAGEQPIDQVIEKEGPAAYFSNIPVKKMVQAVGDAGVPARLSNTAGTFVCNHVLYQLGNLTDTEFPALKFGFIHVPYVPEQFENKNRMPSMALEDIIRGLHAAIEAMVDEGEDLPSPLGELH